MKRHWVALTMIAAGVLALLGRGDRLPAGWTGRALNVRQEAGTAGGGSAPSGPTTQVSANATGVPSGSLIRKSPYSPMTWMLSHDSAGFASGVGRICLSQPESMIAPQGRSLQVTDEPKCVRELRTLSQLWDRNPGAPLTGVYVRLGNARKVKDAVKRKFGRLAPAQLHFVTDTRHCACMVLSGGKAAEVAAFINGGLK